MVRLLLGEQERLGHQRHARGRSVVGPTDRRDDEVQHVDGAQQSFDDVRTGLGLAKSELGPSGHHLHLVGDVVRQCLGHVERTRHPVDEGQHVDCERGLQRRVLVELVEHDVRVGVALQSDHETRLAARRVVLHRGHAFEVARLYEVIDLLFDRLHRDLVGELGDDDTGVATVLLHLGDGPYLDRTASRAIGVEDPLSSQDLRAGREVGSFHEPHEVIGCCAWVREQVQRRVDDLTEVMWWDLGRHPDSDSLGTVHEQVREATGQHRWLLVGVVVVGFEVDGLLVD